MSGITKTIPKSQGIERIDQLYSLPGEFEFHMAGSPTRLKTGEYVYTIFNNLLYGRLRIIRLEPGHINPKSGKPRTLIFVVTPGDQLPEPVPHKGHRGTRYFAATDLAF